MGNNLSPMLALEAIAKPRIEKVVGNKKDEWPYVGLEHMASGLPELIGAAHSSTSASTNSVFHPGDVLFGKLRPYLRKSVGARNYGYCSTDIIVLTPCEGVDASFAAKIFQSEAVFARAVSTSIGTKMPRTSWKSLRTMEMFCPVESEQRRIAEILDTLDEAIRKTEQVIAKLQQMKQGLLHDLLTRGIDENGELRDPEWHPEQFTVSPFGRIPLVWKMCELGDVIVGVIDFRGRTPKKLGMSWGGGSIPALSAKNVRPGHVDLSLETYYGSQALYERWMTHDKAAKGDVLITMEAPLGIVAQIPDDKLYILSQRVVLLKFNQDIVLNDYMAIQMQYDLFQSAIARWSTGTTATGIQRARLVKVPVVLPPVDEQIQVVGIIGAVEVRIKNEQATLAKLRMVKTGLMVDLLTGRVRASIPEESES